MNKGVSTRINKALNHIPVIPKGYGRTSAVAKLFGERHQSVRQWLGPNKEGVYGMPDVRKIPEIARILDVSIGWLLTGEGPMRNPKSADAIETTAINEDRLSKAMEFIFEEHGVNFFKLAIHKQGRIIALIYDVLADDGVLDEHFKAQYGKIFDRTIK